MRFLESAANFRPRNGMCNFLKVTDEASWPKISCRFQKTHYPDPRKLKKLCKMNMKIRDFKFFRRILEDFLSFLGFQ